MLYLASLKFNPTFFSLPSQRDFATSFLLAVVQKWMIEIQKRICVPNEVTQSKVGTGNSLNFRLAFEFRNTLYSSKILSEYHFLFCQYKYL